MNAGIKNQWAETDGVGLILYFCVFFFSLTSRSALPSLITMFKRSFHIVQEFYFLLTNGRKSDTTSFWNCWQENSRLVCGHAAVLGPASPLKEQTYSWVALLSHMLTPRGWHGRAGSASQRAVPSTETSAGPSWRKWVSEIYDFPLFYLWSVGPFGDALSILLLRSRSSAHRGEKPKACDPFKPHQGSKKRGVSTI